MLAILRQVLKRPGAFVDIGANVGQTLMKILTVDPDRQYVGFEPQVDCCFYLQQFLTANNVANAQVVPVALSDKNGLFPLYSDKPNDDMASLLPAHIQRTSRSCVSWCQVRIGDEVLAELAINQISAMKMDVEGLELEVLRGLMATLSDRPPILFEVLTNHAWGKLVDEQIRHENNVRADRLFSLLSGLGYTIYRLDASGRPLRISAFDLDTLPGPGFGEGRDYLAQAT